MGRIRYEEYLGSSRWQAKRQIALAAATYKCQKCGFFTPKGKGLHVHHLTYRNLGDEPVSDLQVLCKRCHMLRHNPQSKPAKNPRRPKSKRFSRAAIWRGGTCKVYRKDDEFVVRDMKRKKTIMHLTSKQAAIRFAQGYDSNH